MSNFSGLQVIYAVSRKAGGTIAQYSPVKLSAENTVIANSAQGEQIDGIALHAASSGDVVSVLKIGKCPVKIKTATSMTFGDLLTPSATAGQVEEAASGDYVFGQADAAPSASGDLVEAFINTINPHIKA